MTDRSATERWARIESLFRAAFDIDPSGRSAFLAHECPDDPALRGEVERLLERHEASEGFLEQLDAERAAELLDEDELEGITIGRYRVLRQLGSGGMGVVYLAHDPRLDRAVAIKLLPPRLAADEHAKRRLMAEARAASALDHPNIATIFEVDETEDGRPFVAMAAYEGTTLRERLRAGPLSSQEALAVAAQVASALAAAHAVGIVHRDVKPGNIILTPAGVAKLVDFGIAKTAGSALTQEGQTLGTVAYMSPEQTRGEPVDARTDVWSLGVVMHEMLSGRNPFARPDDAATIQAIRHDAAPAPAAAEPRALARVIDCCLQKDPTRRYASGGAAVDAIESVRGAALSGWGRRIVVAVAAVLLIVSIVVLIDRPGVTDRAAVSASGAAVNDRALRLAVLPFTEDGAREAEHVAEGFREELTSRLSTLAGLEVIARGSVNEYVRTGGTLRDIGDQLGVHTVLEGRVQAHGDSIAIAVTLLDTRGQQRLWARAFDVPNARVSEVQRDIADSVAAALSISVASADARRLGNTGTANPQAHDEYTRGRYFWTRRNPDDLNAALNHFRRALDHDPLYARAWAGLADTYELLGSSDALPADEASDLAEAAARRALELDDQLAEAHTALATVLATAGRDWEGAESHFRKALASNPSYVVAHQRYSMLLSSLGRFDEGVRHARLAQRLDPLSSYARAGVGYALYLARRYDDAIAHLETARSLDPAFGLTYINLALARLAAGQPDSAVTAMETLARLWGESPAVTGLLGRVYAAAGRMDDARASLEELRRLANRPSASSFHSAVLWTGLGQKNRAIAALDTAVTERAGLTQFIGVEPVFDPLRTEPAFKQLLARMNLPR